MNKFNKKGFTLIEMLVVIAIIAVLVSIVILTVTSSTAKAQAAANAANLRSIKAEIITEFLSTGTMTETRAEQIASKVDWKGTGDFACTINGTDITVTFGGKNIQTWANEAGSGTSST